MKLRIGVVGIGAHGRHHVRLLSQMEGIELAGVFDIDAAVTTATAAGFGAASCPSLDELLGRVDCVSVAVPTTSHCDVVMRCLEAGCHVLVEKPIALSVSEAESMVGEAKRRGLVLSVGHIERFNSAYRSAGDAGASPVFIESHRLAVYNPRGTDVAVVLDLMI
ncbi:MAG: Gfo/Idh/MocA family oxidoreductase, partial [Candidatus Latescibacteria bacterium]|nr:Gfo/Idh/MocA family oxidoreductase [Candidatus Latescibacterota bacterium]